MRKELVWKWSRQVLCDFFLHLAGNKWRRTCMQKFFFFPSLVRFSFFFFAAFTFILSQFDAFDTHALHFRSFLLFCDVVFVQFMSKTDWRNPKETKIRFFFGYFFFALDRSKKKVFKSFPHELHTYIATYLPYGFHVFSFYFLFSFKNIKSKQKKKINHFWIFNVYFT